MAMHIYFSGVGGVGIGPLAMLALDAGYTVSGSDAHQSDMTKNLAKRGVDIYIGSCNEHVSQVHSSKPIDWFVHTAALPKDHPELLYCRQNGIKISKRDEFLNLLLEKLNLEMVAVSGTHGKTTTTAMIVWLFKKLGIPVSYSIGTTVSFGPPAQYQKGSKYFVYEADEFDRNMLSFKPKISVIPSLEYDHPDTYKTKQDYLDAFTQFSNQSDLTILWESDAEKLDSNSHLFVMPEDRDFSRIKLAGAHNRRNAWLAATAINRLKFVKDTLTDWNDLLVKISSFPGTGRRFEKIDRNLYSDYAHHPSEIAATISLAKELNPDVVTVYQPHQNVRQRELLDQNAYHDCFNEAKKVYWLPTYLSREDGTELISPKELAETISSTTVELAEMNATLSQKIKEHLKDGDLVVAMSAGDLDSWLRKNFS
jgi:UDP-N-acetylmuramate--alanine ligase